MTTFVSLLAVYSFSPIFTLVKATIITKYVNLTRAKYSFELATKIAKIQIISSVVF